MTFDPNGSSQPGYGGQPPAPYGSGYGAGPTPPAYGQVPPQAPVYAAAPNRTQGPVTGSTTTKWIWLALACQIATLLIVVAMPWNLYAEGLSEAMSAAQSADPAAAEQVATGKLLQFSLWSGVISLISLIPSAGFIIFAYLDWRDLGRIGIVQPFHWAFAFLGSLVHGIGRAVVLKNRGYPSWGPLWGTIAIQVGGLLLSGWIVFFVFDQMFRMIATVGLS